MVYHEFDLNRSPLVSTCSEIQLLMKIREKYCDYLPTVLSCFEAILPVPEPSDVEKCIHIDFEAQRAETEKIRFVHLLRIRLDF